MFGIFGRDSRTEPEHPASAGNPATGAPRPSAQAIRDGRRYIRDASLEGQVCIDDSGRLYVIEGTGRMFIQPVIEILSEGRGMEVEWLSPLDFRQQVAAQDRPRKKSGSDMLRASQLANQSVEEVLALSIDAQASDFYLDIRNLEDQTILSMRTYGIVHEVRRMTAEQGKEIARGLFARAENTSWEENNPIDTAFSHVHRGKLFRVRANSLPELRGNSLSCRIRDPGFVLPLDKAGYNPRQQGYIRRMCRSPGGIILVTGETNSGKSTTLASLMKDTPRGQRMIEIADPVEVVFDNVTHCEINHKVPDPNAFFHRVLASTVRQNPDSLVLGEIRDERTARAAQNMAIQGKRVFSTLHTQSCVAAIPRMINLGVDRHLLTLREFVAGIVNQNLVPIVCPDCCRHEPNDPELRERYRSLFADRARYVNPKGCGPDKPACIGGIIGQTLVAEVFPLGLDRKDAHRLIAADELWRLQEYMQREFDIQTKEEHARDKVNAGLIDPELTEAIIGEWRGDASAVPRLSQAGGRP